MRSAILSVLFALPVFSAAYAEEVTSVCSSADQRISYSESRSGGGVAFPGKKKVTFDGTPLDDELVFSLDRQGSKEVSFTPVSSNPDGTTTPQVRIYTAKLVILRYPTADDPQDTAVKEVYRDFLLCKETGRTCPGCP